MADTRQFHEANRDKLVAYFSKGEKYSRTLGVRLEHVIVRKNAGGAISYSDPGGVRDVLERLAPFYDEKAYEGEMLVRLSKPLQSITIEAGGQLELSIGPCATVVDVEREYLDFRNHLDPILDESGLETPMLGYNPGARSSDIELVPQARYVCMDRYFAERSHAGVCMMRSTAATLVSLDYENESDAMRKMRIAQIIAPILALICDNSPVCEARPRRCGMARARVWTEVDQHRVGTVPGSLKRGYSFAAYADYILSREAVLVPDEGFDAALSACPTMNGWRYVGEQTFDEVYAEREMTYDELEHALSVVWPDARLRGFLQIRAADAMPLEYVLAYLVLVKSLFYSKRNLGVLESLLGSIDEAQVLEAKKALMAKGYGAEVYGRSAEFWADLLVVLATGSLDPGEATYLEPIASMVRYRFTLADIWPRLMEKRRFMPEDASRAPVIGIVPRYDFEWTGLAVSDGYLSGLLESGSIPIVLPTTSDPSHIASIVAACDGFLMPGGQDIDPARYGQRREVHTHRSATARDEMEPALIRAIIEADKPFLGVCRGIQSLNVTLGGTLYQDVAEAYPDSPIDHVQGRPYEIPSHFVDVDPTSQLATCLSTLHFDVASLHHQSIDKVGEGLRVVATSPVDGVIEAVEMPGKHFIIGVQWHPEHTWSTRQHSRDLFKAFVDACAACRAETRA